MKGYLANQPAADQVRPAVYVNGSTANCMGAGMYALEIPGAPFEEGYTGGSVAAIGAPAVVEAAAPVEAPAPAVEATATPAS